MTFIVTLLRLLGFVEKAIALEQYLARKEQARRVADAPDTNVEWIDSAKRGDL